MISRNLLTASISELEAYFLAAKGDYTQLRLIAEALQRHSAPNASGLRLKVMAEMFKIKRAIGTPPPSPALTLIRSLLDRLGLSKPDGRPLHCYRLSLDDYNRLTEFLRQNAAQIVNGHQSDVALLVLWASFWFSREYSGGIRKYQDFDAAIGVGIVDSEWRRLIEQGLAWWKRDVVKRAGKRHRLLTIAIEGGFPIRVLQANEGWLSRYLNEVIGRLLGATEEPSPDDAYSIADSAKEELRDTYRQEPFIALAADLALAIMKLRRKAEAVKSNLPPSSILDQIDPSWRDELPIPADMAEARTLVDGMLGAKKIARGLSGDAGCVRVLRRNEKGWSAGLRLSLGGEIKAEALAGLAVPGVRLGVLPFGVLAQILGEELAFLDPPGEDGDSWRLRPLNHKTELENVPLGKRIDVLIQPPNGVARSMPWPGGGSQRSDVLTFEIDAEDPDGPTAMVLTAQGSASLRAERVVVTAPSDWSVRWEDESAEGAPKHIGETTDNRGLWLINKSVLVTSSDASLVYRVEPGVDEEMRTRIVLDGSLPRGFDGADDFSLFANPPTVSCYRGRSLVKPTANELFWRQTGRGPWCELAHSRLPFGVFDIMWRDTQTNFVRDHVRVGVIPQTAHVTYERNGANCRYNFIGFDGFLISPEPAPGLHVQPAPDNGFVLSFVNTPQRRVTFALKTPNNIRAIRISLPFPFNNGIANWDGTIVSPGSEITPSELADLVAFGENKFTLCCELKNTENRYPAHYTLGDRELGLRPLSNLIRNDLASAGIDAWVSLSILGNSAPPWRIKLFDCKVDCTDDVASIVKFYPGQEKLVLTARSVATPCEEQHLATVDYEDASSQHSIPLPMELTGAWWVYLRSGHTVRSRPSIIPRKGTTTLIGNNLSAAITIPEQHARQDAILDRLNAIAADADGAMEDILWLSRLICSLDGLPASTFDVLTALPNVPVVLARLLLSANDAEQGSIWRLETELPFIWASLPLRAWKTASDAIGNSTLNALCAIDLELEKAAQMAKQAIDSANIRVGNLDPVIGIALGAAGLLPKPPSPPSIRDAAQGYVRRTFDRGDLAIGPQKQTSLFRTPELKPYLPAFFEEIFHLMHLEALDAPIAIAVAAQEGIKLTPAQIRRCKEAMVADPPYFADGITAKLLAKKQ